MFIFHLLGGIPPIAWWALRFFIIVVGDVDNFFFAVILAATGITATKLAE
jgi:hypothetical protein